MKQSGTQPRTISRVVWTRAGLRGQSKQFPLMNFTAPLSQIAFHGTLAPAQAAARLCFPSAAVSAAQSRGECLSADFCSECHGHSLIDGNVPRVECPDHTNAISAEPDLILIALLRNSG